MSKDYYAVLGLSRGADDVVVHAAWKALLRKYHPDANADAGAQARARDINEAFAVLGKPASRATYDRNNGPQQRAQPNRPPPHARPNPYSQPYRAAASRPPVRPARSPRQVAATLLLLAAIPALALLLTRYPDALPELGDRLRSYADIGTSSATFAPASFDITPGLGSSTPPPLDRTVIAAAVKRADRVLASGGIPAAIKASRACDAATTTVPALDDCVAFNIAISLSQATTPGSLAPPDPYFTLVLDRDAIRADQLGGDTTRTAERLATIRDLVIPQSMALLIARMERNAARLNAGRAPTARQPADALSIDSARADSGPIAALDPRRATP